MVVLMKPIEKSLVLGIILTILYSFVNFGVGCENINKKVLRLHILANSDTDIDQNIKMKIKNEIQNFANMKNKEEAIKICNENLVNMEKIIYKELRKNNENNKKIEIKLGKNFFKTREYSNITMPAGTYDSLQIKVGSGKGKNWWCILFPVLCLGVAYTNSTLTAFNKNEKKITTNKKPDLKFKFKILELHETLKKRIRNIFQKK